MPSYKDKDTGKWFCSFYYTDYLGQRKKKKKRGFALKKDAEAWEREFLLLHSGSPDMLFSSLCDAFLDDYKGRVRETTYNNRIAIINKHIRPNFDHIPVNKIDALAIRNWQNRLMNALNPKTNKPLSATHINQIVDTLSIIIKYAVLYYGLPSNPCEKIPALKAKREPFNIWSEEQFNVFVNAIEPRDRAAFMMLFYCGLRIGELLALTWEDIDIENKTVSISKSLYATKEYEIINPPKTPKGNRTIGIPDKVIDELIDYKSHLYKPQDHYRVFLITRDTYRHILNDTAKEKGLTPLRLHDLRHSHISHLIHLGINPVAISHRAGHENVSITLDTYGHLYPDADKEIMSKLNK